MVTLSKHLYYILIIRTKTTEYIKDDYQCKLQFWLALDDLFTELSTGGAYIQSPTPSPFLTQIGLKHKQISNVSWGGIGQNGLWQGKVNQMTFLFLECKPRSFAFPIPMQTLEMVSICHFNHLLSLTFKVLTRLTARSSHRNS